MPGSTIRRLRPASPCRNFCCPLPASQLPFNLALPTGLWLICLNICPFPVAGFYHLALDTLLSPLCVRLKATPPGSDPTQSRCSSNCTSDTYTFLPHADYTSYTSLMLALSFGFPFLFNTILPPFLPHLKAKNKASVREMKFDWMLKLHRADCQR